MKSPTPRCPRQLCSTKSIHHSAVHCAHNFFFGEEAPVPHRAPCLPESNSAVDRVEMSALSHTLTTNQHAREPRIEPIAAGVARVAQGSVSLIVRVANTRVPSPEKNSAGDAEVPQKSFSGHNIISSEHTHLYSHNSIVSNSVLWREMTRTAHRHTLEFQQNSDMCT